MLGASERRGKKMSKERLVLFIFHHDLLHIGERLS